MKHIYPREGGERFNKVYDSRRSAFRIIYNNYEEGDLCLSSMGWKYFACVLLYASGKYIIMSVWVI